MGLEWNFDHEKLEKSGGLKGIEWDAIGIVELDFMECHIVPNPPKKNAKKCDVHRILTPKNGNMVVSWDYTIMACY